MYTTQILDKLNLFFDDIAKQKHGNSPEITYGELITRIVESNGKIPAFKCFPEIGEQTFHRLMKRNFPDVKLNGGEETWFYYFLSVIEHKLCGKCSQIKAYSEYYKDLGRASGVTSHCKVCRSIQAKDNYSNYYESHQKSYAKNAHKIKARNSVAKFSRKQRVVSWTEAEEINTFYANCPEGYQVDHVIPLLGKNVSGLHVLNNLQYLPARENLQKGNKYTPVLIS